MSAVHPRIVSPELDVGSRWRLLTDLNFAIDDDEASAETLLKAFDLSLYDGDAKPPRFDDVQAAPVAAELTQDSFTDLPPSSSQNPFLSTPLRLKHFSKLSPSILRALLRSPSLRSPSFGDDSLDSAPNSISLSHPSLGSPARRWRPNNSPLVNADSDFQSRQPSLPLTPPPTGRIPFSTQLHNPYPPKPCNVNVNVAADISIPFPDTANAVHTTPFTFPAPQLPDSLISPSAVRNFQRVIDEMKGVESGSNSAQVQAQEPTRIDDENEISFLLLSPHPSSPLAAADGGLLTPETDTHDPSPPLPATDRTLGALEDEFVALLQQRAMEEEEDAQELRALADRLERVAKGRRHLAATIMKRKNEQHKLDSEGKLADKK
ncbi:hypothetical protein MVEN_01265400 [Mycena venus]|uniref:Uncharacterized protein n=1 Tax=Mycena venus TaxID=2733690 RepID=A0A8H7CZD2_9AGAR|nr:hypothetical protein MVEN_01265400 [Mycena venus]